MDHPSSAFIDYKDYTARFKFIRKYKDAVLGEATLIKDTVLNRTLIVQEKTIRSQELFEKEIQICEHLLKLGNCSYTTKFYGYTYRILPISSSKSCNFYQIREHLDHDLEREVSLRLKNKTAFSEEEIWKIAQQCISILSKLQMYNFPHGNIRPRTILLTKEGDCKIHWSIKHQTIYHQLILGGLPLDSKCCLSPEILYAYSQKNPKPSLDPFLSDTFSLGMTLLFICSLGGIEDLYSWDKMTVNNVKIAEKLHLLRTVYSEKLVRLIEKMIKLKPVEREDFVSLEVTTCSSSQNRRHPSSISDAQTPKKLKTSPHKKTPSKREFKIEPGSEFFETYTIVNKERKLSLHKRAETPISRRDTAASTRRASHLSATHTNHSKKNSSEDESFGRYSRSRSPEITMAKDTPVEEKTRYEVTVPYILRRAFSPLKDYDYRTNESVLRELHEQIVYSSEKDDYRDGIITKTYPDGARYEGSMRVKQREGYGIYYYKNGDIYAGEWKEDQFHGRGVYLFANGERYEGTLAYGMKDGQGVYYYCNKNKYLGDWRNDKKHGKGAFFFFATNEVYEGDWENGERHGLGTFYFATGDKFIGNWIQGEKLGKGRILYANGAEFEGQWVDNKPNGFGEMSYSNGDKYSGDWLNGLKYGMGLYCYTDGSKYHGEWKNDDKEGSGEFFYSKGDRYSGSWKSGMKHGHGIYYYKEGGIYDGQWNNDQKSGEGTLILPDGTKYEGTWSRGERSGRGYMMLPNGDSYEGDFQYDTMHGNGRYKWANEDVYDGEWDNNMMHGEGFFIPKEGEIHKGIWDHQRLTDVSIECE